MKKKALSLALALIMCLGLLPVIASAAETRGEKEIWYDSVEGKWFIGPKPAPKDYHIEEGPEDLNGDGIISSMEEVAAVRYQEALVQMLQEMPKYDQILYFVTGTPYPTDLSGLMLDIPGELIPLDDYLEAKKAVRFIDLILAQHEDFEKDPDIIDTDVVSRYTIRNLVRRLERYRDELELCQKLLRVGMVEAYEEAHGIPSLTPAQEASLRNSERRVQSWFDTYHPTNPQPADPQPTNPQPADPQPSNPDTPVENIPASGTATPTNDKLTVDGAAATPTVYKIGGSNYFKIRDVAALLDGTEKQFAVGYDSEKKSVTATTGEGYTKLDTDLLGAPSGGNQTAEPSNDAVYINGQKADAEVYKINGGNYFKLRDLGKALNFYVGWTKEDGMFIDTSKPYSE